MRTSARKVVLGAGLLLAWGCLVPGMDPALPPPSSASRPAAGAGPHLNPFPPELARRMKALVRAAEKYRGLQLRHRVPWGTVSEDELRKEVLADFQADLPPGKLAALELSLKAFGFVPESMDLKTYYPDLLASQIAGFYDPHFKVLAVVDRHGSLLGKELAAQYGADMARRMEDGLLIHELTHVLQDQNFNLDRWDTPEPLSDPGAARLALVEGDASLIMFDNLARARVEELPAAPGMAEGLLADPDEQSDSPPGMPGEKEMRDAPAWFRDTLLFSYAQGYAFCLDVKQHGGQKLLDYAFATDPPRSTEQILHPEKWYGRRDDPISIVWPDLAPELPGFAKASEGQLGEEGIKILLRRALDDRGRAAAAAAGWGGDRFAVYRREGQRLLAWIADWDTEADAARFQAAAAQLGSGWIIARPAPRRVIVLRGALPESERAAVAAKLAAARAELPANRPIDPALLFHPGARP
ncbi:MAG TPA: hypothetical protein VHR45_06820 [Thermoanaerobaculia bacterium]|nr:hypothetical protein [Thermoanaerobaculia bacterium]